MIRLRLAPLLLLLALPGPARAATGYGVAVGSGLTLDPAGELGFAGGAFSVMREVEGGPAALLRLRGEVLALWSRDGSAILPELSADLGGGLGPVELWLTGGLQLFGFAWRADFTLFTSFGLLGGAGLGLRITEALRLELRGLITWLPLASAARISEPAGADEASGPTLLFANGLFGLSYSPRGI
jgi:hypothetical protein